MPAARSVAAVARPSARATDGRPVAAIAGALRDGAPGSRCTLPPSWSTISSSGARRRPAAAARRSVRVSARTCAGVPRLAPRKMTPAASPRRMRASSARGTVRPAKGKTTCWPASCASVRRGPRRGRAGRLRVAAVGPVAPAARLVLGAAGGERQGDGGERGGAGPHRAKLVSAVSRCAAAAMSRAALATSSSCTISTGECM